MNLIDSQIVDCSRLNDLSTPTVGVRCSFCNRPKGYFVDVSFGLFWPGLSILSIFPSISGLIVCLFIHFCS